VARLRGAVIALASVAGVVLVLANGDGTSRHRTDAIPVGHRSALGPEAGRRLITIGYSVAHRPIRAVLLGDPRAPRSVLVVGCIHGNEQAGIAVAKGLAAGASVRGTALWIVPVLNPDGVAADTRQNGDGVDLNRNFPYRWRLLGSRGYPQARCRLRTRPTTPPPCLAWPPRRLKQPASRSPAEAHEPRGTPGKPVSPVANIAWYLGAMADQQLWRCQTEDVLLRDDVEM
jgi:hypothetical protein